MNSIQEISHTLYNKVQRELFNCPHLSICKPIADTFFSKPDCIGPMTILYHITPLDYFLENYSAKQLKITNIRNLKKNNDELEGYIFQLETDLEKLTNFIDNSFSMSFTAAKEKYEMWNSYGVDKGHGIGVRVAVYAKDMICTLCNFWKKDYPFKDTENNDNDGQQKIEAFLSEKIMLRPVEYTPEKLLKKDIEEVKCCDDAVQKGKISKESFLKKCDSFRIEEEIRYYTDVLPNDKNAVQFIEQKNGYKFLNVDFDMDKILHLTICPLAHPMKISNAISKLKAIKFPMEKISPSQLFQQ